jgi:WD40 repeat protein
MGKGDIIYADKDISVTSLTFLSPERNHLLVTGSEACTSLRLWDIRSRYSRRNASESVPVSSTTVPYHHQKTRPFGITAIATNTNSSRIYALSRDSTVYAYSAQHLVLGSAPEMLSGVESSFRYSTENQQGLAPLFGLRHPDLIVSSFYIKGAMRRAQADKSELLATGSADGNIFLFPTDEREIRTLPTASAKRDPQAIDAATATPLVDPETRFATPVYHHGTKLMCGHSQRHEVSHVVWTHGGELLSCGDDYRARLWRENRQVAIDVRKNAQQMGSSTHWIGYADVKDEDDEDEW